MLIQKSILPTIIHFSVLGCKLRTDSQLQSILQYIKSPIFDFNSFVSGYKHLITKKLVTYMIKDYK